MTSTRTPALAELRATVHKYLPGIIVAAVAVYYLAIASRSLGPAFLVDEVGYLANAHILANPGSVWELCGDGYAAGLSLLLVPLWWIFEDPGQVYVAAIALLAAIGIAVIWPASRLAERMGATRLQAVAAGALVTLPATRSLMANYVLTESVLAFLAVTAAAAAVSYAHTGRLRMLIGLAAAVGGLVIVHGRALPLAAVTIAWVVLVARRHLAHIAIGIGTVAIMSAAGLALQSWVTARTSIDAGRFEDAAGLLGRLEPERLWQVLVGQLWYQGIAWTLLTFLGGLVLVRWWWARRDDPSRAGWAWLIAATGAQALFFVVFLAGSADSWNRLDIPIYGRYVDPFVVPLAVVGSVVLLRAIHRRLTLAALGAVAVSSILVILVVEPTLPDKPVWLHFAIPGVVPYLDVDQIGVTSGGPWVVASGVTVAICLVVVAMRRRPAVAVSLLALFFVTTSLIADTKEIDPFEAETRNPPPYPNTLDALGTTEVALTEANLTCYVRNKSLFWLADLDVTLLDQSSERVRGGAVIAPGMWTAAEESGAVLIPLSVWQDWGVWVFDDDGLDATQ